MHRAPNRSLFALLFSDLMMGATAVIVVVLVFLSIVEVKGEGEAETDAVIELSPGLLDTTLEPRTSLRIVACPTSEAKKLKVRTTPADVEKRLAHAEIDDCGLQLFSFPEGLNRSAVEVLASEPVDLLQAHVTAFVGGWRDSVSLPQGRRAKGEVLMRLSRADKEPLEALPAP